MKTNFKITKPGVGYLEKPGWMAAGKKIKGNIQSRQKAGLTCLPQIGSTKTFAYCKSQVSLIKI
jgi:hypothetical protein